MLKVTDKSGKNTYKAVQYTPSTKDELLSALNESRLHRFEDRKVVEYPDYIDVICRNKTDNRIDSADTLILGDWLVLDRRGYPEFLSRYDFDLEYNSVGEL